MRPDAEKVTLACEPLVSADVWNAAQAHISENAVLFSGARERRCLLAGLLRCPKRGRALVSEKQANGAYYRCKELRPSRSVAGAVREKKMRRAAPIEEMTLQAIAQYACQPEAFAGALPAFEKAQRQGTPDYGAEVERLRGELAELANRETLTANAQGDALTKGRSAEVYDRLLAAIEAERAGITAELADANAQRSALPRPAPEDFSSAAAKIAETLRRTEVVLAADKFSPGEKQPILAALIQSITPAGNTYGITLRGGSTVQLVKRHWNTITVDGEIPVDEILAMTDASYTLVRQALPKAQRDAIGA